MSLTISGRNQTRAIAALAGHRGTNLIMDTYGNAKVGRERITELLD